MGRPNAHPRLGYRQSCRRYSWPQTGWDDWCMKLARPGALAAPGWALKWRCYGYSGVAGCRSRHCRRRSATDWDAAKGAHEE